MVRKVVILVLMSLYIYTLTFDVFLNTYLTKTPAPLIFGLPLIFLFADKSMRSYWHGWETLYFLLANFFFYAIGQSDFKSFLVNAIVFIVCSFFFNFFVGRSIRRLNWTVLLYIGFLTISVLLMFADHQYTTQVDNLRVTLMGSMIVNQSPAGISTTIFGFGYQAAALVGFLAVYALATRRHLILVAIVFLFCILTAYYGMQRSVFVGFAVSVTLYLVTYYGFKSVPILMAVSTCCLLFFVLVLKPHYSTSQNIFNKNEVNIENGENRQDLFFENLRVYADYPFGLMFYGKQWKEVTRKDPVFSDGQLTSHNAYLMFFTYLGPFLAGLLLILMFYNFYKVFWHALLNIQKRENALLVSLCFAFVAVSINALFHNAWLGNGNGVSVFLYLSILHYGKMLSVVG